MKIDVHYFENFEGNFAFENTAIVGKNGRVMKNLEHLKEKERLKMLKLTIYPF